MRKKVFRGNWEVLGVGPSDGKKEIEIFYREIPNKISCAKCRKDLKDFAVPLKVLEDTNQLLNHMMSNDIQQRPSAQDLKSI